MELEILCYSILGLNSGMRISDVIVLKYDDVRNSDGSMKRYVTLVEKKTNKVKRFPLVNGLLNEMEKYTKNMKQGEYLFKSRKGQNRPISTTRAYRNYSRSGEKSWY